MIYSCAKVKGQRSVGSEYRVETNGRTEVIALPPILDTTQVIESFNILTQQPTYVIDKSLGSSSSLEACEFGSLSE